MSDRTDATIRTEDAFGYKRNPELANLCRQLERELQEAKAIQLVAHHHGQAAHLDELRELRKDKDRLDFLSGETWEGIEIMFHGKFVDRDTIDAAMEADK